MARIVRAGEASSEAERRNEGSTKCVRNPEKPVFCEAKSHPKKKNLKFDICPNIMFYFEYSILNNDKNCKNRKVKILPIILHRYERKVLECKKLSH